MCLQSLSWQGYGGNGIKGGVLDVGNDGSLFKDFLCLMKGLSWLPIQLLLSAAPICNPVVNPRQDLEPLSNHVSPETLSRGEFADVISAVNILQDVYPCSTEAWSPSFSWGNTQRLLVPVGWHLTGKRSNQSWTTERGDGFFYNDANCQDAFSQNLRSLRYEIYPQVASEDRALNILALPRFSTGSHQRADNVTNWHNSWQTLSRLGREWWPRVVNASRHVCHLTQTTAVKQQFPVNVKYLCQAKTWIFTSTGTKRMMTLWWHFRSLRVCACVLSLRGHG